MDTTPFTMDDSNVVNPNERLSFLFHDGPSTLRLEDEGKGSTVSIDPPQFVNPQYTDKRYCRPYENQCVTLSRGFMTPSPSTADMASRRPSLMLSDTSDPCSAGPMSASSTSSFSSSPGYPTPCSSSVPTAASSRRQSAIYPDSQNYCLSAQSPTPTSRLRWPRQALNIDHYSLQEPFSVGQQRVCTNSASIGVPDGIVSRDIIEGHLMSKHDYTRRSQTGWHGRDDAIDALPTYEESEHDNTPTLLGVDPVLNLTEVLGSRIDGNSHTDFGNPQHTIFSNTYQSHDQTCSQPNSTAIPPLLLENVDYQPHDFDVMCDSDDDNFGSTKTAEIRRRLRESARKDRQLRGQGNRRVEVTIGDETIGSKSGKQCHCEQCPYSCNRREHLRRHERSIHHETKQWYPCKFPKCGRKIKGRGDNHKAHYNKTHFSYGHTEKSGKNHRYSMKISVEMKLQDYDKRWAMLLAGSMDLSQEVEDHLSVWKMIGYSIRETRNLKVKEVAPKWEGPEDATLEAFDPRWKALRSKSLDYERAMSVGHGMLETPRQGLLGVDMRETEEMGIKDLDPRWKMLLSGGMSVEDSEKLGVKALNPAWKALQGKRKQRHDD